MTPTQSKSILIRAFGALTKEQQGNLRWHLERGTGVCCGPMRWSLFADGRGRL